MTTLAEDKIFMFTGKLSITRPHAERLVIEADGIPGSSVNSRTHYLVVGERPGSKLFKAEALGTVEIIDEREFYRLLEEIKYEELPVEEWKENNINIISSDIFENILVYFENETEKDIKQKETSFNTLQEWTKPFSYQYASILNLLLEQYPNLSTKLNLEPKQCNNCGHLIPYSVRQKYYYCFNCHSHEASKVHTCVWEDDTTLPSNSSGKYKNCNICGNFKFFENAEFDEYVKLKESNDFGFSAEVIVNVMHVMPQTLQKHQYQGSVGDRYSEDVIESLYAQYQLELSRRKSRRETKFFKKWGIEQKP